MQGPAGGENKKRRMHTKTGNASEGFIRPVAAPLRTWVVPHVDWLIKVAAVSLQVRRSGKKIKKGYEQRVCALPNAYIYVAMVI